MRVHPSKVPPPIEPRDRRPRARAASSSELPPWVLALLALVAAALTVGILSHEDPYVARYDRWAAFRGCVAVSAPMSPDEAMAYNTRCVQLADALLRALWRAPEADAPAALVAAVRRARVAFEAQMPLTDDDRARLVGLGNVLARRAWAR